MSRNPSIMILGLLLLVTNYNMISITKGDPDVTVVNVICNQNLYGGDDPYGQLVCNVIDDLIYIVPDRLDYTACIVESFAGSNCYGYAKCNLGLLPIDCCDCLAEAAYQLVVRCPDAIGGTIELVDCGIRYEDYAFC